MPADADRDNPSSEGSSFVQRCAFCGARLRVTVIEGPGQGQYSCPECGKHYTVKGATGPHVTLLEPRRDGRADPYSETMF